MKNIVIALLSIFVVNISIAQCDEKEQLSIGEILLADNDCRSIFRCKVTSEWLIDGFDFKNEAEVLEVFRGEIPDKINLTFDFKKEWERKIFKPNEEFLIFGTSEDNRNWHVLRYDNYSISLSDTIYNKQAKDRLKLLREFFRLKKEKKSGRFELKEYSFFTQKEETIIAGEFQKGKPHGEWKIFEHNLPKANDSYTQGRSENFQFIRQVSILNFSSGILEGISIEFKEKFRKTELEHEVHTFYERGKKINSEYFTFFNGEKVLFQKIEFFVDKNGLKRERHIRFHPSGKKALVANFATTVYGNNSRFLEIESFPNGKFEGFHENGEPKLKGQVFRGAKIGKWEYFAPNGTFEKEEFFENVDTVLAKDEFRIYFPDGRLRRGGKLKNNLPTGIWEYLDSDGRNYASTEKIPYENGEIHGQLKRFDKNGLLVMTLDFLNGKEHGEQKSYFKNSSIRSIVNLKKGEQYGTYKEFNEDGSLKKSIFYDDKKNGKISRPGLFETQENFYLKEGIKNGDYTLKHLATKKILLEGKFKNGQKIGKWVSYRINENLNGKFKEKECFYGNYKLEIPMSQAPEKCYEYDESGKLLRESQIGFPN